MHDIRAIRDDPAGFDAGLMRRGRGAEAETLLSFDAERRKMIGLVEEGLARRKRISREIGQAKSKGDDAEVTRLMNSAGRANAISDASAAQGEKLEIDLKAALAAIPNLPAADVPDGTDESGNVEQKVWGQKPTFAFAPRDHADLGPPLGLDFEAGARLSGARFTVLRGPAAKLNRALGQYMLDQHSANGHEEVTPPLLVRDEAMFGTGQLPKFAEDLFRTEDGRWLIPTAEVSLTNLAAGQIVPAAALPIRLTALTPCFRAEAGAAGRDTRGLIRQHQFDKVELVTLCAPEESAVEHERMTLRAESILEALGLPYRRMLLCAGDMGFAARKTYDLEVWLPGQGLYREISSCSDCGDFQARRMEARYRPESGKPAYLHTLNGSGLAVGRALVAVIENYQEADGGVRVPEMLRPYLGGLERIAPPASPNP